MQIKIAQADKCGKQGCFRSNVSRDLDGMAVGRGSLRGAIALRLQQGASKSHPGIEENRLRHVVATVAVNSCQSRLQMRDRFEMGPSVHGQFGGTQPANHRTVGYPGASVVAGEYFGAGL